MYKEKSTGEKVIAWAELKMPKFSKEQLWDFTLKEICKNMGCSDFDFCVDSKRYYAFKRRFDYYCKSKQAIKEAERQGLWK